MKLNTISAILYGSVVIGAVFTSYHKMANARQTTTNFCDKQELPMAGPYTCLQGDQPVFTEDL